MSIEKSVQPSFCNQKASYSNGTPRCPTRLSMHNSEAGLDGLIEAARLDLHALQDAQVDAIMFGNENDRPYELK